MSYDIAFYVETKHPNKYGDSFVFIGAPEYDNPTYNLRDMFVACMDWDYRQGDYYPWPEVEPKVSRGIRELQVNKAKYEQYNPPNGWGNLEGALRCLKSIMELVYEGYDALDNRWNVEHLWFRW